MKLNVEEILMVIIAFIIGWFLSNMMNRGFLVEGNIGEGCTEDSDCGSPEEQCSGEKKCAMKYPWNIDLEPHKEYAYR